MPIGVNVSLLVNAALVYSASHIYDPQNALLLAVLFTALFVSVLFSKSYRKGAGKQGAPALWRIIWAHSVFLAILLGFIWLASRLAPALPDWMTESSRPLGKPDSPSDFLFFGVALVLHGLERLWLYVQSGRFKSAPLGDDTSAPLRKGSDSQR